MRLYRLRMGMLLGILSVAALTANAQNRISVSGTVTDASGAVVAGAEVHINVKQCKCEDCENPTTCDCCPNQITVETSGSGTFDFSVPHGTYQIDVSASSGTAHLEVDLNSGDQKNVSIHLKQG
jgi:hypothetical protein